MATPNSEATAILQSMEKATDDTGFVARVEKRINDALDEIAEIGRASCRERV